MKRHFFILTLIVVLFSSCSKEPQNLRTSAAVSKTTLIKGSTTDEFEEIDWRKYEDDKKFSTFKTKEISSFPIEELLLTDVYQKDEENLIVAENIKGEVKYYEVSGESFFLAEVYENTAVDKDVISTLKNGETFWGYQRLNDYLSIIKDSGTYVYKGSNILFMLDGVAKLQDLDDNGTMEVVQRNDNGKSLCVYEIEDNKLIKLWEIQSQSEAFDGDIQIGDLNSDGVKEIYVGNTFGNMIKFILTDKGFIQDMNMPVAENGVYYLIDYDRNNKMDIIIQEDKKKPVLYLQK